VGVADWPGASHTDELDLIGPRAQRVLGALGVVRPPNVHLHLPLAEAARRGLLTDIGCDELFAAARRFV
jgi:hypothetical protein